MSEIKRAIKALQRFSTVQLGWYDTANEAMRAELQEDIDAVDLAVKALEKQVAKKPLRFNDYFIICPVCRAKCPVDSKYCKECGQRILEKTQSHSVSVRCRKCGARGGTVAVILPYRQFNAATVAREQAIAA
jgi:translation initiation factor 2 beta subunit (eIF-2beta)/eIF-5